MGWAQVPAPRCYLHYGTATHHCSRSLARGVEYLHRPRHGVPLWWRLPACLGYGPMDLPFRNFFNGREGDGCLTCGIPQLHVQLLDCLHHSNANGVEHSWHILCLRSIECCLWTVCLCLRQGDKGYSSR